MVPVLPVPCRRQVNATYLVGITAPSGQVVEAMLAAQLRPGAPVWLQCAFEAVTRVCFSLEALGRAPGSAAGGAVGSGAASPPPPPPAALLTAGLAGSLRVMAASVSLRCGPGADWPPGGSLSVSVRVCVWAWMSLYERQTVHTASNPLWCECMEPAQTSDSRLPE